MRLNYITNFCHNLKVKCIHKDIIYPVTFLNMLDSSCVHICILTEPISVCQHTIYPGNPPDGWCSLDGIWCFFNHNVLTSCYFCRLQLYVFTLPKFCTNAEVVSLITNIFFILRIFITISFHDIFWKNMLILSVLF